MKMNPKVERTCPICGAIYLANPTRLGWGRETTCSRACSYLLRGGERVKHVTLACAFCKKKFRRLPNKIKGKHGAQFCSKACHYKGISAGLTKRVVEKPYVYTEEGIAALRKAGATAYAAGKTLAHPQMEVDLAAKLRDANIPFVHQFVLELGGRAFAYDFFLPESQTLVELDHPIYHAQPPARQRDREKNEVAAQLGVRLIRVRQTDLIEDIFDAVVRAARAG